MPALFRGGGAPRRTAREKATTTPTTEIKRSPPASNVPELMFSIATRLLHSWIELKEEKQRYDRKEGRKKEPEALRGRGNKVSRETQLGRTEGVRGRTSPKSPKVVRLRRVSVYPRCTRNRLPFSPLSFSSLLFSRAEKMTRADWSPISLYTVLPSRRTTCQFVPATSAHDLERKPKGTRGGSAGTEREAVEQEGREATRVPVCFILPPGAVKHSAG